MLTARTILAGLHLLECMIEDKQPIDAVFPLVLKWIDGFKSYRQEHWTMAWQDELGRAQEAIANARKDGNLPKLQAAIREAGRVVALALPPGRRPAS